MIDLHCHILPGVDDGAPDMESAVEMARALRGVGFRTIAPSPHFGEGSNGDVPLVVASETREKLAGVLAQEGIELALLPNAEHHLRPSLFDRLDAGDVMPIGGPEGKWILVEFPWQPIPEPEDIIFRLQMKGFRVVLAHP